MVLYIPCKDTVVTMILFGAGSIYEPANKAGMSHLLEHILFRSKHMRKINHLEGASISYNAITSKDFTLYYVVSIPERAQQAIDALLGLVCAPKFTQKDVDHERKICLEELYLGLSDSDDSNDWFSGTPYVTPTEGTPDTLQNIRAQDVKTYYNRMYKNAVRVLACPPRLKDRLVRLFHDPSSDTMTGAPYIPYDMLGGIWSQDMIVVRPSTNKNISTCTVAIRVRPYDIESWIGYKCIEDLLGGSLNSTLLVSLREKRPYVYSISASTACFASAGVFVLSFSTSDDICSVFQDFLESLASTAKRCVASAHFKASREDVLQKLKRAEPYERCLMLGQHALYTSSPLSWPAFLDITRRASQFKRVCTLLKETLSNPMKVSISSASTKSATTIEKKCGAFILDYKKKMLKINPAKQMCL